MFKAITYKKWYESGLALIVFLMLVFPKLVAIGIVFFAAVIFTGAFRKKVVFKFNWMNFTLLLIYVGYLIGTAFTNHMDLAQKYLEYKMVLVLFPLLFSFVPLKGFSLKIPIYSLLTGVLLVGGLGLIHSIGLYAESNSVSSFLSGNFSYIHHPTYYAAYAFLAMIALLFSRKNNWLNQSSFIVLLALFIILQFITVSLAGILILLFFGTVQLLLYIKKRFGRIAFAALIVISPIGLFLLLTFTPGLNTQFETSKKFVLDYIQSPIEFIKVDQTYVQGDETRLIMWTAAGLEIMEHPMGVGTGNIDDHLNETLLEYGQIEVASHAYNPHNQYLQIWLEIGLIGFLLFIGVMAISIVISFKTKFMLLGWLGFSLAFNSLFESMLQRQSGIVFYTFWLCLLVLFVLNQRLKGEKSIQPID